MAKKILIIGSIIAAILITITLSIQTIETTTEIEIIQGDVIMPSKVSRPGCEKTDSCYVPSKFEIKQGKPVTWVNEDSAFHSVTSGFYDEPSDFFDSGHLDPFESFTVTFDDVGTFDYFCTLHPWMKGKVIVE